MCTPGNSPWAFINLLFQVLSGIIIFFNFFQATTPPQPHYSEPTVPVILICYYFSGGKNPLTNVLILGVLEGCLNQARGTLLKEGWEPLLRILDICYYIALFKGNTGLLSFNHSQEDIKTMTLTKTFCPRPFTIHPSLVPKEEKLNIKGNNT